MPDKISLIIPTYNEKANIAPLFERISQALSGYSYEIILVDDDSRDGTIETAQSLSKQYPVKVIVRKNEKGLATAVTHGLKFADGQVIGVMDADLQHPPEVLPDLVKAIGNGADMAVASRYIPGGGAPNFGFSRRLISKGALKICHLLLPSTRKVKDPMTGFFMFKRGPIEGKELKPIGYKIMLEVLLVGDYKNVVEVPFVFQERSAGLSKLRARTQIDYLKHLLSLMLRTGEITRLFKFIGVGLSGVVVNEGILWILTRFGGLQYYISSLFAIEISIISNFVLNDYFTFSDRRTGKTRSFIVRLLKFNVTCAAGAGIQYGLLLLFTSVFGVHYLISNIIGIVVAFLWNYFFSTIWAWK